MRRYEKIQRRNRVFKKKDMITIDKKDIIVAILIASNKSLTDLDVYDLKEHNITIDECDMI